MKAIKSTETNKILTETPLIAVTIVLVAIISVFVFKKGYVTIEMVNEEENPQDKTAEEKKPEVSPYDETLDY